MGQTSAGVAWPVRTHSGAWDDRYDEPCKGNECCKHAHMDQGMACMLSVMLITDTGNDHATQPKSYCTDREEVELAKQMEEENVSQREEDHSELLLQETGHPYKFYTL